MPKIEHPVFWMVWHEGDRAPTYRHPTKQQALAEAERLAKTCPGDVLYVLKATGGAVAKEPEMQRVKLVPDDLPF